MKFLYIKYHAIFLFTVLTMLSLNCQERVAKGFVFDKNSNHLIEGAMVIVADTDSIVYTDAMGGFNIPVPKKHRYLLVELEGYKMVKIPLAPGFQHKPIRVGLQPIVVEEKINKTTSRANSKYRTYKNVITFSPLELFTGAVALRYERLLVQKHSIGTHASFYLFGRNPFTLGSEHDYYVKYQGLKLSPFYRFYPFRKETFGLFADAKFSFGYIHFNELDYHYGSNSYPRKYLEYSFWTIGGGISIGIMFKLLKTEHGIINISVGYQYLPIDVPETIQMEVSDETTITLQTDTYWWYLFGPGARFDLKFTIGGIF